MWQLARQPRLVPLPSALPRRRCRPRATLSARATTVGRCADRAGQQRRLRPERTSAGERGQLSEVSRGTGYPSPSEARDDGDDQLPLRMLQLSPHCGFLLCPQSAPSGDSSLGVWASRAAARRALAAAFSASVIARTPAQTIWSAVGRGITFSVLPVGSEPVSAARRGRFRLAIFVLHPTNCAGIQTHSRLLGIRPPRPPHCGRPASHNRQQRQKGSPRSQRQPRQA